MMEITGRRHRIEDDERASESSRRRRRKRVNVGEYGQSFGTRITVRKAPVLAANSARVSPKKAGSGLTAASGPKRKRRDISLADALGRDGCETQILPPGGEVQVGETEDD